MLVYMTQSIKNTECLGGGGKNMILIFDWLEEVSDFEGIEVPEGECLDEDKYGEIL